MKTKDILTCSICGTAHINIDDYLKCVKSCVSNKKKEIEEEKNKKHLEAVNKDLNAIKQAEKYFNELKDKFKKSYPEEYELNFGNHKYNCSCEKEKTDVSTNKSIELSYERNGKEEPKMTAKVNGKQVGNDYIQKLFENPETKYIAQLLGIM